MAYSKNYEYIEDELIWLDLLLLKEIERMREDEYTHINMSIQQGLFISEQEVKHLLEKESAAIDNHVFPDLQKRIEEKERAIRQKFSTTKGFSFTLPDLAGMFGLSDFETRVILICLAPELNRKYDRLYAYLQDDITRKRPSIDLVLRLLCGSPRQRWEKQAFFHDSARLIRYGLVEKVKDTNSSSGSSSLTCFLRISNRITCFLLGHNVIDEELFSLASLHSPLAGQTFANGKESGEIEAAAKRITDYNSRNAKSALIFHIKQCNGMIDKSRVYSILNQLGIPLLFVDMKNFPKAQIDGAPLIRNLVRECILLRGALYIDNIDTLLKEESVGRVLCHELQTCISDMHPLVFMSGIEEADFKNHFNMFENYNISFFMPDPEEREIIWNSELLSISQYMKENAEDTAKKLSLKYRLTNEQIHKVVNEALYEIDHGTDKQISFGDITRICRSQWEHRLNEITQLIVPKCGWDDLVLPEQKKEQLMDICRHIDQKEYIFRFWGFESKYSYGRGISILFSGLPGTGKTFSAEILAKEAHLDLYKIDLSGVVSKYIGETEKNLASIFREAVKSCAILFFDEADALFGKRTEVSDAHDRYANIETSYLLQKMDEYEGVSILATNLKENIDSAFMRRIKFHVDFPFPDVDMRLMIWKTHFPKQTPLADDIDFELLARQYELAGGNIKNIILQAALFGASNGGMIKMQDIIKGTKREYEKMGRMWV